MTQVFKRHEPGWRRKIMAVVERVPVVVVVLGFVTLVFVTLVFVVLVVFLVVI